MNEKKETAEEFVTQKLTGLTAKTLPDYPDSTFYVNDKDELIIEIRNSAVAWLRYPDFWRVLSVEYHLNYVDGIKPLIERTFAQYLNIHNLTGITTEVYLNRTELEKSIKEEGVISENK